MASWVVDTCILIDVLENDSDFGKPSARLLKRRSAEGLVICPVSYVELAPAFLGKPSLQRAFLAGIGAEIADWTANDTDAAYVAWATYAAKRFKGKGVKRPLADVLIGAFALRHAGLVTRKVTEFRALFPTLKLLDPMK